MDKTKTAISGGSLVSGFWWRRGGANSNQKKLYNKIKNLLI